MSPGIWFSEIPDILSTGGLVAGEMALCGALAGMVVCVISFAEPFFGVLLVKGKLEREGA